MKTAAQPPRAGEAPQDPGRLLEVLRQSQAAMAQATGEPAFLEEICRILVKTAGYLAALVAYPEGGRLLPRAVQGVAKDSFQAATFLTQDSEPGSSPVSQAFLRRAPVLCPDLDDVAVSPPWLAAARDAGVASGFALPLMEAGQPLGVLAVFAGQPDAFSSGEQDLLALLAGIATSGVLARRLRQEHEDLKRQLELRDARLAAADKGVGLFCARLPDLGLLECNRSLARMLGYDDQAEVLTDFLIPERLVDDGALEKLQAALFRGELMDFEARLARRDGGIATLLLSGVVDQGQGVLHGVARDLSTLRQVEAEFREAEGRCRALVEQQLGRAVLAVAARRRLEEELHRERELGARVMAGCTDGILTFDLLHRLTRWNAAMEGLTGLSQAQVLGQNVFTLLPVLQAARAAGQGAVGEPRHDLLDSRKSQRLSPSGPEGCFSASLFPLTDSQGAAAGGLIIIRRLPAPGRGDDSSPGSRECRQEEGPTPDRSPEAPVKSPDQPGQTQPREAMGSLAGGLAHDFNNILGVMLGYTEMTLAALPEDSPLRRKLQQVLKAGQRGKELVHQILAFSRPREGERRPLEGRPPGATGEATDSREGGSLSRGRGRILFVDGDAWQGEMWQEILQSLGFAVTAASTSTEALARFHQQPDEYDLVIADQALGPLTGFEVAQAMLAARPELPIILCLGYQDLLTPEKAKEAGVREFALKPLSISDLLGAIQRLLPARTRMISRE